MSVDYDLIVIGNTSEAIYAAAQASNLKMRVALVEHSSKKNLNRSEAILGRSCTYFTNLFAQVNQVVPNLDKPNWQLLQAWTKEAEAILSEYNTLPLLAAKGVDIISGSGEFCRLPHLAFIVNQRRLRSRIYLLATGSVFVPPKIIGLDEINYLTVSDVWQKDTLDNLPEILTIIGESVSAIQLAQNLIRFGKQVTLLVKSERLLPQEDFEISWLLQAQLEAEGIQLFTNTLVTHVKFIDGQKWLQFGNQAIETDEIIIDCQPLPNTEGLNLEGVGVKVNLNRVLVNEKLQTTHSRIYACGGVVAGFSPFNIAQAEVDIILKNILFYPLFKINYTALPYCIFTHPTIARVGLTERQARQLAKKEISVIQIPYKMNAQAQILGTTGFIKLIINEQGDLLGGHIIGVQAEEIISPIAIAIQHKIKIQSLAKLPFPSLTISEIIHQVALEYQNQSLQKKKKLLNWYETLLIWRRKLVKK
ncbi:NAD(P)/FAD-dependent oxidoreductase [Chroococcus sp. FPU101]|uniref:dihydrolipoyl dehydrogenase family protein n=1 Tax=Chroococcus sp. FPU101 TaxID=1974212 RepID=UPI001A8C4DA4|nr:NAD(P)/FAD-dependent oxidoreductase [Chroococcus sp. FPU101]GFE67479.1 pyridine nucleotide-disulphide oxidoreductase dimerisation region [Chroococcus sp. FPU101]